MNFDYQNISRVREDCGKHSYRLFFKFKNTKKIRFDAQITKGQRMIHLITTTVHLDACLQQILILRNEWPLSNLGFFCLQIENHKHS